MTASLLHGACGLVLGASAAAHLRRPRLLARTLAVHDVAPSWAWWPAPPLVVAAEVAVAGALLGSAAAPAPAWSRAAGTAAALLFAGYGGYLGLVARRHPGETSPSCGCGVGEAPVGTATVVRAAVLAVAAGAGGSLASGPRLRERPVRAQLGVAAGAAVLATLATRFPRIITPG